MNRAGSSALAVASLLLFQTACRIASLTTPATEPIAITTRALPTAGAQSNEVGVEVTATRPPPTATTASTSTIPTNVSPPSGIPTQATVLAPAINLRKLRVVKTTMLDIPCNNLVLAPDNEHFVCNGSDGEHLWLGSLSEGIEKPLAKSGWADWLPDGKQLLYSEIIPAGLFPASPEVYLLDVATGERTLTATGWSDERYPIPGGVLYFTHEGLVKFNSATRISGLSFSCSEPIWKLMLYHCGADPAAQGPVMSYLGVSPDGSHIAFLSADGRSELLHVAEVASERFVTVTQTSSIKVGLSMAWSPDSSQLAYGTSPHGTEPAQLWMMNADGTSLRRLDTNNSARMYGTLDWMPDGQTLIATMIDGEVSLPSDFSNEGYSLLAYQINAIDSIDGTTKELTKGYGSELFAGGRKLLFTRGSGPYFIADLDW